MDNAGGHTSGATRDWLRESVIITALVAALATMVGAAFSIPATDQATAGRGPVTGNSHASPASE